MDYKGTRANQFDALVGEMQWERALRDCEGGSALDVGCGWGLFTKQLCERFERVVGIDETETFLLVARGLVPTAIFVVGNAETFIWKQMFDHIFMVNVLEHVEYPVMVLERMKGALAPGGTIHIVVPNAYSFHRVIGLRMGLIDDLHYLPEEQIELYGHKRVYDPLTLEYVIGLAGLNVTVSEGIVLKFMPNADMQRICDEKGKEWSQKFIRALCRVGESHAENCSSLYMEAQHVEVQQDAESLQKPF